MRKAQKEQICNFLELLKQAHEEIKKNIERNNLSSVLGLLEDAQDGMIIIGNYIEKTDGKHIVPMLEAYCEMVYQIHEKVITLLSEQECVASDKRYSENSRFANESYQDLKILLGQIENAVKNDIAVKQEVVFLPYKASMWDSLESVWKAASEDVTCEAYVIPIPYFDRNADGTLGEMHYEGELYPDDVPITSYEEFDLEEMRPDKIFIHNPYDEYNRVTSVHPSFYSSKLKNCTEELVYIPYFVLNEIEPDDAQAIQHMEHFCKVPAVLNAHKVIVQSEKMKQVYVKVLTEWMGADTRPKWERKILGLGSPKLDKVTSVRKEDIGVPSEWMNVIQKTDGSWKKIIFYNTSISAFLEHSEQMLEKIENVFQVFEENKDEIALLWRPHPLMLTTIESMRPELLERYHKIVNRYKEKQIGIYDDTSDLNRAIGLADAYFGDPSSVVQLCQKAGMPVMIQDVEISYE